MNRNFLKIGKKNIADKVKNSFLKIEELIGQNKVLSIILLIALSLRILGLIPNNLLHPDEPWVKLYSGLLAHDIIVKADFDPHTYKYGSFIFYLEAIPYILIYIFQYFAYLIQKIIFPIGTDPIKNFRQYVELIGVFSGRMIFAIWMQRAFVVIMGALSVLVLYKICAKLFNKHIALLSAFFLAILPLHVRDSHYITTDIPLVFFMLLCILFMINLFQTSRLKWYVLSGLMVGFSSTIRFFPIAILPLPIAILYDKKKGIPWIKKTILGILAIVLGIFIGVPFLFLNPGNINVFREEMIKWVLPWYSTTITSFLGYFSSFILSFGKKPFPSLELLLPTKFKIVYVTFLFFKGAGGLFTILSVIGFILGVIKYKKALIFLSITPVFTFIYISSYISAQYERLAIPLLPFMAIYTAVATITIYNYIKKNNSILSYIFLALIVFAVSSGPFYSSFTSSWACGDKSVYEKAEDWIRNNIPENQRIAVKEYFPFPSNKKGKLTEMTYWKLLSLEEVRQANNNYAFIDTTTLFNFAVNNVREDFFIPPADLYKNNYAVLTLYEYDKRAKKINEISKPEMCAQPDLLFYKIPSIKAVNKPFKKFEFEDKMSINDWKILQYSIPSKVYINYSKEGYSSSGSLEYRWEDIPYTPPRIVSKKIPIVPTRTYTLSGRIKLLSSLPEDKTDGYLRVDIYSKTNQDLLLPGITVALSPRAKYSGDWEKVYATFTVPPNGSFAVISLNAIGLKTPGSALFDDIELLKE